MVSTVFTLRHRAPSAKPVFRLRADFAALARACSNTLETLGMQFDVDCMPQLGLLPRLRHLNIFDMHIGVIDDLEAPRLRSLSARADIGVGVVAHLLEHEHPERFPELQTISIDVTCSIALELDTIRTICDICHERGIELRLIGVMISSDATGDYLGHLHRLQRYLCGGLTVEFGGRGNNQRDTPPLRLDLDNLKVLDLRCLKRESVPAFWMAELSAPEQAEALLEIIQSVPALTDLNLTTLSEDVDVPRLVKYIGQAIMSGRFPALRRLEGSVRCGREVITRSVMQQMEHEISKICTDRGIESTLSFRNIGAHGGNA